MEPKYELTVIAPYGLDILDRPIAQGRGARRIRSVQIGARLEAADIFLVEGVPYAELLSLDPMKPEFCRISEAGGLSIDDRGHTRAVRAVKAYAKVTDVFENESGGDPLIEALRDLTDAIKWLKTAIDAQTAKTK